MNNFCEKCRHNFNIPNLLSCIRILVITPFVYYFLKDQYFLATIMLLLSGLSDMLDGFIARKFNQITRLGSMLDPIADKLTLAAVVCCIGIKFPIVVPVVIILILKEVAMLVAGLMLIKKHKVPTMAKWYGKLATIIFYFSVAVIVALKAIWGVENELLTVLLMSITAVAMLYALVRYFLLFLDMYNIEEHDSNLNENSNESSIIKQDIQ